MWLKYKSIEHKEDLVSRTGKSYSGYVLTADKINFDGGENTEYSKILFPNTATTVIEHGISRSGMPIVQFFQKACKPGDTIVMRFTRAAGRQGAWDIESVENISNGSTGNYSNLPDYEPLTDEEVKSYSSDKQVITQNITPVATALPWMN